MKRLRKDCGGFTLVEIIVTFTLTAIFMGSAALVLSAFMRSHTVASAVATEQNVASIVMETVSSNLSAARWGEDLYEGRFKSDKISLPELTEEQKTDEASLLIGTTTGTSNSEIWYIDGETENVVRMYVKENSNGKNNLELEYYVDPGGENPDANWECVPWHLGEGVYQNCSIKSFRVERINIKDTSAPTTCLSVTLVFENGIAGKDNSFTLSRTFDCYNLAAKNIVELTS